MTRKRHLALVLPAVAALALSACGLGGQQSEPNSQAPIDTDVELSGEIAFQTWSLKNEKFTPYFEGVIDAFEAENPGTTINWLDQPADGYQDKLLQQVQSDTLPDVINLPPDIAFQVQQANALLNLEAADPDTLPVYTTGGIDAYRYDGIDGVYGYPWYLGTGLSFWNTDLMEAGGADTSTLPTTFDEFAEVATTIAQNGGTPLLSAAPGITELSPGIETVYADGKFIFNTPEAAAVLQQYVDLYAAGAMPPEALANDYAGNAELYKQGKVAFTTGTASFAGDLQNNAPTLVDGTEVSPLISTPPLYVQGISVSANSENPALALAFAQFVTNNTNQVEFVKLAQGFLPGTVEANENPESFSDAIEDPWVAEVVGIAASSMQEAHLGMPVQWSGEMNTFAAQQIALALRGDITPQAALDLIADNANTSLNS